MKLKIKEIAAKFGRGDQWLRQIIGQGFVPEAVDHKIDFEEAAIGIYKYQESLIAKAEGARSELAKSRSALAEEEVLAKRQKRMKLSGELVPLADVELVWTARKTAVRQRVDLLPISKRDNEDLLEELERNEIDKDLK